jgi:hypothetical protein
LKQSVLAGVKWSGSAELLRFRGKEPSNEDYWVRFSDAPSADRHARPRHGKACLAEVGARERGGRDAVAVWLSHCGLGSKPWARCSGSISATRVQNRIRLTGQRAGHNGAAERDRVRSLHLRRNSKWLPPFENLQAGGILRPSRNLLLLALLVLCIAAIAWIAIRARETLQGPRSQASLKQREERHAKPNEAVRQLFDRKDAPAPHLDGQFPCVVATVDGSGPNPQLGECAMPSQSSKPLDRVEADLRYGSLVIRQSDLYLKDVFEVPVT